MKKFRINSSFIFILFLLEVVFLSFLIFPNFYNFHNSLIDYIFCLISISFFQGGIILSLTTVVELNTKGLRYYDLIRKEKYIDWDNIKEINTTFYMDPSLNGYLFLVPKKSDIDTIRIPISFFKLDLVREVIRHVPGNVNINLYTYLRQKLEVKQTWFFKEHF